MGIQPKNIGIWWDTIGYSNTKLGFNYQKLVVWCDILLGFQHQASGNYIIQIIQWQCFISATDDEPSQTHPLSNSYQNKTRLSNCLPIPVRFYSFEGVNHHWFGVQLLFPPGVVSSKECDVYILFIYMFTWFYLYIYIYI